MRASIQLALVVVCCSASTTALWGQEPGNLLDSLSPPADAFVLVQDQPNPPRSGQTTPPSRSPMPRSPMGRDVPGATQPPRTSTPSEDEDLRSLFSSQESYSLASTPPMFGDVFFTLGQITSIENATGNVVEYDLPSAGGSRRVKIAENNSPVPGDRVLFMYNHFENVLRTGEGVFMNTMTTSLHPIDRYTVGAEKSFFNGIFSAEIRMPFTGGPQIQEPLVSVDGGQIGNLAVILKALVYSTDNFAFSAGVGLDLPTGSNATSQRTTIVPAGNVIVQANNEAFHVLPYIGFTLIPNELFWVTGFAQMDLATNGNTILVEEVGLTPLEPVGVFTEQNIAYFDLAAGVWVYRNPCARLVTGLAATAEFHYNTSMQDTDQVFVPGVNTTTILNNPLNRFDIVHMTVGVHAQIGPMTSVRVAGVLPVSDFPDQVMDSEVQVQVNRQF